MFDVEYTHFTIAIRRHDTLGSLTVVRAGAREIIVVGSGGVSSRLDVSGRGQGECTVCIYTNALTSC